MDYSVRTGGGDIAVRVRVLEETGAEVAASYGPGTIRIDGARCGSPGAAYLYDLVDELIRRGGSWTATRCRSACAR